MLGTASEQVSAASYNATSDYRIKADVETLDSRFSVDGLRPVYYTQISRKEKAIGFIAHELQAHFPCLVTGEKDGEHMQTVNYTGLIGVLTHEIQGLKRREAAAAAEVAALRAAISTLALELKGP